MAPGAQTSLLKALLIAGLAVLVNSPALRGGFIWDDNLYLTANPLVRADDGLRRMWFTGDSLDYYPLSSSTLWLEWRIWGRNPAPYHATNLALHALTCVLLFAALKRLGTPGAFLAALFFAVHPVCTEAAAWISQRKTLLAACLATASMLAYLKPGRAACGAAFMLFVLAMLSKTSVVGLPLAFLAAAWWKHGRIAKADVVRVLPFLAAAAALALVTIHFQHTRAMQGESPGYGNWGARVAGTGWAFWFYLWKAWMPVALANVYPKWTLSAADPLAYAPLLAACLLFALLWRYRDRYGRGPVSALAAYAFLLAPVLGIADIGFMVYSFVADHWQYPALAVAMIPPAALLARCPSTPARTVLAAALVLVLGQASFRRAIAMQSEESMWRNNVAQYPGVWMGHEGLGETLLAAGRLDEAARSLEQVIALEPGTHSAYANLGLIHLTRGEWPDAIKFLEQAAALEPERPNARFNLARALVGGGRPAEAVEHFEAALKERPRDIGYLQAYAWFLATQQEDSLRDGPRALELAERALDVKGQPTTRLLDTLAAAQAACGDFAEAAETVADAISLARTDGNSEVADKLARTRLALYEQGQPYREP